MTEARPCPVCEAPLSRCTGSIEMPASQEYWQCARCGLSAHRSWFQSESTREELRQNHLEALRRRVDDGRVAERSLEAAGTPACCREPSAMALGLVVGGLVGLLLGRLLPRS